MGGTVQHDDELSKVSVVGHGMQTHTGVAAQMFRVLANEGTNIKIVTTSEIKISVLIDRADCNKVVNAVHRGFQLNQSVATQPRIGVASTMASSVRKLQDAEKLEEDIVSRLSGMEDIVVSDVYCDTEQARVTIKKLVDRPGVAADVFTAVADGGVLVDMIIQNAAQDGFANISFTVPVGDVDKTVGLLGATLEVHPEATVSCDSSIGKLSVVGIGLRSHTDVGARMFRALADHSINVQMVNTSEIKVSVVVAGPETQSALRAIRQAFNVD